MRLRRACLLCLCLFVGGAAAAERVAVCHDYGCQRQSWIDYDDAQLGRVLRMLSSTVDAAEERKMLAEVIGRLYRWAGEQSDIRNDRGGNYADDGIPGRMDCIDHATSTTRLLELLARHGGLRRHRVLAPVSRAWLGLVENHWAAQIEERRPPAGEDGPEAPRFVVDSWFVDNGEPAVILPLEEWKKGAGPDV